ncbi:hypothetical protein ACUOGK_25300, partial [Escherichia coli]
DPQSAIIDDTIGAAATPKYISFAKGSFVQVCGGTTNAANYVLVDASATKLDPSTYANNAALVAELGGLTFDYYVDCVKDSHTYTFNNTATVDT